MLRLVFLFTLLIFTAGCEKEPSGIDISDPKASGIVIDIDGNVYRTVKIGNQWWMAENLRVTSYRNGEALPNVTGDSEWETLTEGAYCYYNNNADNAAVYGCLYNWYAVVDSCGLAPAGWHVSTDEEWKQLEMNLGMSRSEADGMDRYRGSDEGGKLKETGTIESGSGLWNSPNEGAVNSSGFSALPGGYRYFYGWFYYMGRSACFWSITTPWPLHDRVRVLNCNTSAVDRTHGNKPSGFSVRCVKD